MRPWVYCYIKYSVGSQWDYLDDIGRQRDFKSHTCTNLIKGAMQGPFENNLVIQVDIDIGGHGDY